MLYLVLMFQCWRECYPGHRKVKRSSQRLGNTRTCQNHFCGYIKLFCSGSKKTQAEATAVLKSPCESRWGVQFGILTICKNGLPPTPLPFFFVFLKQKRSDLPGRGLQVFMFPFVIQCSLLHTDCLRIRRNFNPVIQLIALLNCESQIQLV